MLIKTIKNQVEWILRERSYTRNSDITLWVEVICEFYWPQFFQFVSDVRDLPGTNVVELREVLQALMVELPRQDEIKRLRARLNQQGKYVPTDWLVAKRRGMRENDWKLALGYSLATATPAGHAETHQQQQHLANL